MVSSNDPLKSMLELAMEALEQDRRTEMSANTVDKAISTFNRQFQENLRSRMEKQEHMLDKEYRDIFNKHKKVSTEQGFNPKDFSAKYLRQINNRVKYSIDLIRDQQSEHQKQIASRFINWFNVNSPEMRKNDKKLETYLQGDNTDNHAKFVIDDQSRKLASSFMDISAEHGRAIGMVWLTRQDNKVVGKPGGEYPKGTEKHNNHYVRQGKLYLYKDNWWLKHGYIKKTQQVEYVEDLEDGLPGVGIGCRCTRRNIFSLDRIPKEYLGILTEKGKRYLDNKR